MLIFLPISFASNISNANDARTLEQIFQEILIGQPLPNVNYVYLPKDKGNGLTEYEGMLGKIKIKVTTTKNNESNIEIVKSYFVGVEGAAGEKYLGLITNYFGKPTEKIDSENSTTKHPVYVQIDKTDSTRGWMLFTAPRSMALMVSQSIITNQGVEK
jgi:hypothetical protein